jgi:antitoxin MazE
MKAHIVKMGNSRGVRIPKALLEQTGLAGEVEITVRKDSLVIHRIARPRVGWDAAFAEMAKRRDDRLAAGDVPADHSFDQEEWEWK